MWLRTGMAAVLVGLDLRQAMASLRRGLDRDLAAELFITAEAAFVLAVMDREKEEEGSDGK